MHPNPSTELALRAFDANAAFSAALAEFQAEPAAGTIIEEARRAASFGLSWFCRPSEPGFIEVRLRHKAGAEISADGESITALLAGLLGHPLAQDIVVIPAAQAAEPEQEEGTLLPATRAALAKADAAIDAVEAAAGALLALPAPSLAQVAAEYEAAATGGVVVTELPGEYVPDPNELLTDSSRQACISMIKAMNPEQRKSFTIAFRDAFRVPRDAKAITPLITEIRHWDFYLRWSAEASGDVAA